VLDLDALIAGMRDLTHEVVRSAREGMEQRERALAQLEVARRMPGLREAILRYGRDMALPAPDRDMGRVYPASPAEDYTVIATDGSQVPPDYHHVAPWYAINAGCAVFRYGAPPGRERCRLSSFPKLLPPRREIRAEEADPLADARAAAIGEAGTVEVHRLIAELELAQRLLEEEADPGRTVLLLDGPLVQWRMITILQPPEAQEAVIALFRRLLRTARELDAPVAGFISRSRAVAWITLLRFTLCPSVHQDGRLCRPCAESLMDSYTTPAPGIHHGSLAGVRDIELAQQLLPEPGMRSEVVALQSRVWDRISEGAGAAGFFYLNTGMEIARVELPQWIWEDAAALERLHAALWDQCEAGRGYPMALAEAHEAAVVRGADRSAFYAIIERVLDDNGEYQADASAKALSKRRPMA